MQTSTRNLTQVSTQTSSTKQLLKKRRSAASTSVSTQTSKRCLPNMSTQTSAFKRILPDVGVQTSVVAQPVSPESSYTSTCGSESFSSGSSYKTPKSSTSSVSSASSQMSERLSVDNVKKELENRVHNYMVTQERVNLEKLLESQKKKLAENQR